MPSQLNLGNAAHGHLVGVEAHELRQVVPPLDEKLPEGHDFENAGALSALESEVVSAEVDDHAGFELVKVGLGIPSEVDRLEALV